MSSLATIFEYNQFYNLSTDQSAFNFIQSNLDYSTSLVENYCDRVFNIANYLEQYKAQSPIFLSNYPIIKIRSVNTIVPVLTIQNVSAVNMSTVSKQDSIIDVYSVNTSGVESTNTINLSSETTLNALITAFATIGILGILKATNFGTQATKFLQNQDGLDSINGSDMYGINYNSTSFKIDKFTNRMVTLLECNDSDVLINYQAGYTVSQDASGHDSAVVGNVPNDLKQVVLQLSNDIYNYAYKVSTGSVNGNPGEIFKSESIVDYSYTRFDDDKINKFLTKYSDVLDSYRRLTILEQY